MKSNKIIKWLYGLFMFVPFLAIGVKCLYVTFNKNAKDSYYGETINEQQLTQVNITDLENGTDYIFENEIITSNVVVSFNIYPLNNFVVWNGTEYNNILYFTFYYGGTNSDIPYMATREVGSSSNSHHINLSNNVLKINFKYDYLTGLTNGNNSVLDSFYSISYNKYSYLDNAFYYAIDEFNNVGFNKLDFVSWFSFLYENTNIFTTFLNCYVNYMLFVSVAFFIPRVLYWFVNYAYSLTETFSSKSNGGGW